MPVRNSEQGDPRRLTATASCTDGVDPAWPVVVSIRCNGRLRRRATNSQGWGAQRLPSFRPRDAPSATPEGGPRNCSAQCAALRHGLRCATAGAGPTRSSHRSHRIHRCQRSSASAEGSQRQAGRPWTTLPSRHCGKPGASGLRASWDDSRVELGSVPRKERERRRCCRDSHHSGNNIRQAGAPRALHPHGRPDGGPPGHGQPSGSAAIGALTQALPAEGICSRCAPSRARAAAALPRGPCFLDQSASFATVECHGAGPCTGRGVARSYVLAQGGRSCQRFSLPSTLAREPRGCRHTRHRPAP